MGMLHEVKSVLGKALRPVYAGDHVLASHRLGVPESGRMGVASEAFGHGEPIPTHHAAEGGNVSPPLRWTEPPQGTRELVLLCEDPDAPFPKPFVHWILFRIPPDVRALPEAIAKTAEPGVAPGARQGKSSKGTIGFFGPAPPIGHGVHHYHFQVFALDAPLAVSDVPTREEVVEAMRGHVLGFGEVVGTYEKT